MAILKEETKDNVFEHSQAKLDFYKNYLSLYLTILLNNQYTKKINIYDVFCGMGIYEDGNAGSPIIAINVINNLTKKYPSKDIALVVNDIDKGKVDFVKHHIETNFKNTCDVKTYNLDAEDMLRKVKKEIHASKKGVKNLVFIDPYGYKEIYKKDICDIMSSKNSEIIVFLPIAQMYRFSNAALTDEENNSYRHLRRFIEDFFPENHPIQNENLDSQIQYIDYIKDAFSCDSKYYTASYSIQRDNKNYYALFFITNHIYGLDKIVNTKWELDNNCGEGFSKKETKNLFHEEFNENKKEDCFNVFRVKLKRYLSAFHDNNEIYEFTIKNGFLPKHTMEILKKEKLNFDRDIRKNAFYLNYDHYKNNNVKYKVKIDE